MILRLAMTYHQEIRQINVNNFFLNGNLTKTIYINQPKGFITHNHTTKCVCKLNKVLYGLKHALIDCFEKLKLALITWGFISSVANTCLFIYKSDSTVIYIIVYVDDILLTGNNTSLINTFITELNEQFALIKLGPLNYFLGFEVHRIQVGLHLCQSKYEEIF